MNREMAQSEWRQLSGRIKRRWGKLTDDDLVRAQGDRDYLVGRVQERYGIARELVEDELQTLGYREDDQDVDLRSSDRSAAGRMDAAGFANAGSGGLRDADREPEQGGNLDREDPGGRSNTDSAAGVTGDERDEEQNPSLRVEGQPQQPGGAGHTLEAGAERPASGRSAGSKGAGKPAASRGGQGPGGSGR